MAIAITAEAVPLETLASGERGEIVAVEGASAHVARLGELGLRVGQTVQVEQPGRLCLLLVGSSRLSLRLDASLMILVRPTV